ncbi:MAG: serine--tRNA ligase [Alphaproteobacteria bacterium]
MFDIRWIRDNPEEFDAGLARRGVSPMAAKAIELDAGRRKTVTLAQEIQARRNKLSKEIGIAKARGEDVSELMEKVSADKGLQAGTEEKADRLSKELEEMLSGIPNLPAKDVPDGADETANVELRSCGEKPEFDFTPMEHFALGEGLGMMDFERAAKLSGARFVVLSGALARLARALGTFMLDLHTTEFGYTEVDPPLLVRDHALFGTGQLPKFAEDQFRTTDDYWLIPTAEVPLTNLVADKILDESRLPLRFAALTPCFRSEAGAAGKDTRGMIRQHQFDKVELVSITHPEGSEAEHERMTSAAEEVLRRLELPYRVGVLSTGDMGFSARKTYDIDVWLPGENRYLEVSSCSNCTDFQARRMNARYRRSGEKGTRFVHTLNGSGLAVGRTLVGVIENYQQKDGSVRAPGVLRPLMGGLDVIAAES